MSSLPARPVVWVEIPVRDLDAACRFYGDVFGWSFQRDSAPTNDFATIVAAEDAVAGHLYPGRPGAGAGATIHLHAPDGLDATADRLRAAGGTVLPIPPVDIPVGRFLYAEDPDGNSVGLFEPRAA
ncbi:VOC family protein [Jannaschia sp. W003]|uniref:VOC family protein n=1 Tax=Jannaschia sp. W003 TaxID=2867012 RepID=UPI0021A6E3A8|nr:VOC family protein [Jannaschia sp. W003]UWQ21923.1 VOC family protein [Jannaschia sp. W003]